MINKNNWRVKDGHQLFLKKKFIIYKTTIKVGGHNHEKKPKIKWII
jgi:hypothetical protein